MFRRLKPIWCVLWRGSHRWVAVGSLYRMDSGQLTNGNGEIVGRWIDARAKFVCANCGAAMLRDIEIFYFDDGTKQVFTPEGTRVRLI